MDQDSISLDQMTRALHRLGELLEQNRITLNGVTCGGAVSMLYLRTRDATMDVDALFPKDSVDNTAVKALVLQVAREHNLPGDEESPWFNDSIAFFGLKTRSENTVFASGGLSLVAASWEEMLAHKLNAFRSDKDVMDAVAYMRELKDSDPEQVYARAEQLCPFMPFITKDQLRKRFDRVCEMAFGLGPREAAQSKSQKEVEEDLAWASGP